MTTWYDLWNDNSSWLVKYELQHANHHKYMYHKLRMWFIDKTTSSQSFFIEILRKFHRTCWFSKVETLTDWQTRGYILKFHMTIILYLTAKWTEPSYGFRSHFFNNYLNLGPWWIFQPDQTGVKTLCELILNHFKTSLKIIHERNMRWHITIGLSRIK